MFAGIAGTRGPGSTTAVRFSGSAAESRTGWPVCGCLADRAQQVDRVGVGELLAAERRPRTGRRGSCRGPPCGAAPTARRARARPGSPGMARSRKTTPQRAASCSATASASSSRSGAVAGRAAGDQRPVEPAPAARMPVPQPAPARGRGRPPRRSRERTARNPSAVTRPRATPSHSASSTSAGSRPVTVARSGRNSAPCWRSASSDVAGAARARLGRGRLAARGAQQPGQVVADGQRDRRGPGRASPLRRGAGRARCPAPTAGPR